MLCEQWDRATMTRAAGSPSPDLPPDCAGGLGAGLSIVARSADAFAIRERSPTGTEVWLRFAIDQPAHAL
jgi:anti-sigma regulatory factor (Ser/Thr protein kinase)